MSPIKDTHPGPGPCTHDFQKWMPKDNSFTGVLGEVWAFQKRV